ncbi:MAG: ATP-binding protein [Thermoflexales bacterium]
MPGLIPERLRKLSPAASFFAGSPYIAGYAEQVYRLVQRGQVAVLVAPLGSGKSEVLKRVRERVDAKRGLRAALLDMGESDPPRSSAELWRDVGRFTRPGLEISSLDDPAATTLLRAHALGGKDHIVILIDHAELVDEDWLFTELRAAVGAGSWEEDGRAPVTVVVASTETLAYRLFSVTSPFHGISQKISMADCAVGVRRAFWTERLRAIRAGCREELLNGLDALCGGDPYHIESMSAFLGAQTSGRITVERVEESLRAARANPARIAPLLRRYGELVEADPTTLSLALRLLEPEAEALVASQTETSLEHAGFWRGIFANDGSAWSFRSGLTERFFRQEFKNHPERIAAAHVRHGAYAEATLALAPRRDRFRHGQDALVATITQWVKAASSPSQAWQNAANALRLCFGPATRVLRYAPFRQVRTEADVHFFEVRPGELEAPVERDIAIALHAAHDERVDASAPGEICLRPASARWRDASGEDFVVFPLSHEARPYGAVVLPISGFNPDGDAEGHAQLDHENRWQSALSAIFREIVGFEAQALGGADLSQAQGEAQASLARGGDGPAMALWLVLTAITGGFGLRFNRSALLRVVGASQLEGVDAIGYHTQAEQERAWKQAPQNFDRTRALLRASATGGPPLAALTPMSGEAREFCLADWRADPLLSRALEDGNITLCASDALAGSGLGPLFRLGAAVRRPDNPVLLVPLREGERLLGVLVIDKPFADEPVTQEQFDALPALAFQLGLTLRAAEDAEQRKMFDEISQLGTERLAYQAAAERLAAIVLKTMKASVDHIIVSTWESSADRGGPDRRQVTVRVARDAAGRDSLAGRPLYTYYHRADRCWGPVHEALRVGVVDIPDWPAWRDARGYAPLAVYDPEVRAIVSLPMGSPAQAAPRAVISFQTSAAAGYSKRDRGLFDRIAERAGNILDKARQYESLERGRYLTDQLNEALTRLVEPLTDEALYESLLEQLRAFFKLDAYDWRQERYPDSAALIALSGGRPKNVVAGNAPALALELARACPRMRETALSERTAYVEYADRELLAREQFGWADCAAHHAAGAEASVWCAIGDGLLLLLAWTTPRRISSAERRNLPLLAVIAERTSVLINAERQRLRGQLANSLRVEDYELIEAEQTHQWNRRMRVIRNQAQWAIESLTHSLGVAEAADALKHLDRITQEAAQAQSRLIYGRFKQIDSLKLGLWVEECVKDWRSLHGDVDRVDASTIDASDLLIATRPIVLRWILYELLTNAEEAESGNSHARISIEIRSDPLSGDALITVENPTPLPRQTLDAMRGKTPQASPRDVGRGRGLWIVARQVPTLLGGNLELPEPDSTTTRFTLRLPKALSD